VAWCPSPLLVPLSWDLGAVNGMPSEIVEKQEVYKRGSCKDEDPQALRGLCPATRVFSLSILTHRPLSQSHFIFTGTKTERSSSAAL
jgi:hypothetical protein